MPVSESGRIVIQVEPELKRRLYSALALSSQTLKDWFQETAEAYCRDVSQPSLFAVPARPRTNGFSATNYGNSNSEEYRVVSMFSGCGGMDLGFTGGFDFLGRHFDKLPFRIDWANDFNEAACRTYRRNLGREIQCGDIWDLIDGMPEHADVVIGGFPCQDISVNGKRAGINGARSGLYKAMVEAVTRIKPKVFVAENVKGLLMQYNRQSLEKVIYDFKAIGYRVSYDLYQAANYGVPQTRERVFIVGVADGVPDFQPPRPERDPASWITAKDAIGDLEKLPEDHERNHTWSRANKSPEQGNRRLRADRPGYTVRAECHGNIQFHYRLRRRISMRECARFQSFPDDFIFESKLRETERQVGNAVPPVLAWNIARQVLACLGSMKQAAMQSS